MSSYIAEAFVALRVDTSGIAKDVRDGVTAATKNYKPEVRLKVIPYITKTDINTFVVDKIKATQATIRVTPLLDPKSTTAINTQLAAIKDQVVHVTAVVTKTTQAGASTITSDQIVTPVLNEQALAAIVGKIEAVKPVITVEAVLDPASEAKIEGLKNQVVQVTQAAGAPRAAGAAGPAAGDREAARAARAASEAQAKQAASADRLARADAELKATSDLVTKGIKTESQAQLADEQASKSLARVRAAQAAAIRNEDVALEKQLATREASLLQLQEEIKARGLLSSIQVTSGELANAPVGPISSEEATENFKKAERQVANLAIAGQAAAASGNAGLQRSIVLTQDLVDAQFEEAGASKASALASQEQAAALAKEAAATKVVSDQVKILQERFAQATSTDFSLSQQRAKLISLDQTLIKTQRELAGSTNAETQAELANLAALEARVAATKTSLTTRIQAQAAAERQVDQDRRDAASGRTTAAQIKRGTAATGATFLGLRGAVLSASTGFLGATIALTGLGKIVKTAEDLQHELNIFNAVSGATAEQMVLVSQKARILGADLSLPATSATDAAVAMTELVKSGLSVNETMAASKGVLQLAAAAGIEVADAATIVATELNAFGLEGDQATNVVDNLAGASIAAQGEITDFALAFQQSSAVAHQVGLSFETTTAILTQFAKAGIRGSDAGTSLRTLLLRLVPTTKAASDAQAELGIHLNQSIPVGEQFLNLVEQYSNALAKLGPIAQQEALTKIFGQDAIRGASISLTRGADALRELQAETSKAGSAAEITEGRVEGLGGSIEGLKSEVSTFSATLGASMLPLLESISHEFATVASSANAATTEIFALAQTKTELGPITIPSVTGVIGAAGGTDTITKVAIPALAALTIKSLNSGRLREKAEQRVDKAVLQTTEALQRGAITQEQFNRLMIVSGVKAEEVETIQVRAQERSKIAAEETLLTKKELLKVETQLAAAERATATEAARFAPANLTAAQKLANAGLPAVVRTTGRAAPTKAPGGAFDSIFKSNKIVVENADVAAKKMADGWLLAYGTVGNAALRTAVIQGKGAAGAAEANVVAARVSMGAWLKANAAAAGGALKGGRFGGALGASIAATVAGEAIGGGVGGVLSGAGQGALLGSFIPGPEGPIAGAIIGGGLALVKQAKDTEKKHRAAFKEKWDGMTFTEQQIFLTLNPAIDPRSTNPFSGNNFAKAFLRGLTIKQDPALAAFRADLGDVAGANAAVSGAAEAQKIAQETVDRLEQMGAGADLIKKAKEELARKIKEAREAGVKQEEAQTGFFNRGFFKGPAAQLRDLAPPVKTIELPRPSVVFPRRFKTVPTGEPNPITAQAQVDRERLEKLKKNISDSAKIFGKDSNEVKFAIGALERERARISADTFSLLTSVADPIVEQALKGAHKLRGISVQTKNAMALFAAQMTGNEAQVRIVLEQIVVATQRDLKRAEDALDKAILLQKDAKVIAAKEKILLDAQAANSAAIEAATSEIQSNATRFNPAGAAADLAAANATNNSQALAAARQKTAADQARLRENQAIVANNKKERDAKRDIIAAAKQTVAQDRAAERNIQAQISSDAEQAKSDAEQRAKDAAQAQEDALRFAADAAGNVGKAENALLAFLKKQRDQAQRNTSEFWAAARAYNEEKEKQAAAIKSIVTATQELVDARLQTRLSAADLTPGTADNKAVELLILKGQNRRLKRLQDAAKTISRTTAKGRLEWIAAQKEIEALKQAINGTIAAIKGLDGSSGFSLNDFFKEAQTQFQEFASNVSSSVTSPGQLRGAIAGASLSKKQGLSEADKAKIDKAATTNDLLSQILNVLKDNPSPGKGKANTVSDRPWAKTNAATAARLGKHVKVGN